MGEAHVQSLQIRGLRGVREGELTGLRPLTVLTGPNGCGKSTVLDALLLAGSNSPAEALARVVARRKSLWQGAKWLVSDPTGMATLRLVASRGAYNCRVAAEAAEASAGSLPGSEELTRPLWNLEMTEAPREQSVRRLAAASVGADNQSWRRGFGARQPLVLQGGTELAAMGWEWEPLHVAYGRVVRAGRKSSVLDYAAKLLGPGTQLESLPEDDGSSQLYVTLPGCLPVPVAVAGDGVAAGLQLVMEVAASSADVLLVEEPEVHLHPEAIREVARVLVAAVRAEKQVIVATHSLELIDALIAETAGKDAEQLAVLHLSLRQGALVVARQDGEQVATARFEAGLDLR